MSPDGASRPNEAADTSVTRLMILSAPKPLLATPGARWRSPRPAAHNVPHCLSARAVSLRMLRPCAEEAC